MPLQTGAQQGVLNASGSFTYTFDPGSRYLVRLNTWGILSPTSLVQAYVDSSVRAVIYGVPGLSGAFRVDGNQTVIVTGPAGAIVELEFTSYPATDVDIPYPVPQSLPGSIPQPPAAAVVSLAPSGCIVAYGGAAAPTSDWLLCDGASVLRTGYPDLFLAIGVFYGTVDGTHFSVPDLRQRFPLGLAVAGTGNALGATGGVIDHPHTGPSHTHNGVAHTHTNPDTGTENAVHQHDQGTLATASHPDTSNSPINDTHEHLTDGSHSIHGLTGDEDATHGHPQAATGSSGAAATSAAGTGNTGPNNPPFLAVNYLIKT